MLAGHPDVDYRDSWNRRRCVSRGFRNRQERHVLPRRAVVPDPSGAYCHHRRTGIRRHVGLDGQIRAGERRRKTLLLLCYDKIYICRRK